MKTETRDYLKAILPGVIITALALIIWAFVSCTKVDEYATNVQNVTQVIDSTQNVFNIGGDTINVTVNIAPPVITLNYVDSSTVLVNVGGSTVQEGSLYLTVKGDTTINNVNVVNNLSNFVTVRGDSVVINNNFAQQTTCPYTPCKCIIANCKIHSHKCLHNKIPDCGDYKCPKHHPKCK